MLCALCGKTKSDYCIRCKNRLEGERDEARLVARLYRVAMYRGVAWDAITDTDQLRAYPWLGEGLE